jgi:hypothetical protein
LLTSTNGSDAVENDLPWNLIQKFRNKDKTLIEESKWRKYIRCIDGEFGVLPFLSFSTNAGGIEAERNLDIFTKDVLIPLCIKTNAIVICTPTRACSLGMSFGKAASFLTPIYEGYHLYFMFYFKPWIVYLMCRFFCSGKLPFSVLAIDSASNYVEVRTHSCKNLYFDWSH